MIQNKHSLSLLRLAEHIDRPGLFCIYNVCTLILHSAWHIHLADKTYVIMKWPLGEKFTSETFHAYSRYLNVH